MNLLLIRDGYTPVAVRPEDRKTYLYTLEQASLANDLKPFQTFMHERLDATLDEYLSALQETLFPSPPNNIVPPFAKGGLGGDFQGLIAK